MIVDLRFGIGPCYVGWIMEGWMNVDLGLAEEAVEFGASELCLPLRELPFKWNSFEKCKFSNIWLLGNIFKYAGISIVVGTTKEDMAAVNIA